MEDKHKKALGVGAGVGVGTGLAAGLYALLSGSDPTQILTLASSAASSQIAQAGFFFTIAAWIHSGRVKREIGKNFSSITDAINNVATALREDLQKHGERLDKHEVKLDKISGRVETLEKLNRGEANA